MAVKQKNKFSAEIEIIGINPFVYLPEKILKSVFKQAGKDKGHIPVKIKIDGHEFIQTLVKYSGHWRLYLNTPMRRTAGKDVGENAVFEIEFDPVARVIPMHPELIKVFNNDIKSKRVFDSLSPSRQLEIVRYLSYLKTKESIERNIIKLKKFLNGNEKFAGRTRVKN